MEYRRDIQGLRAIAVLFVFVFHLNAAWLPGGFVGVDIFFVISGFLISSIVLSKLEKKTFSFIDFYRSRIKRIVPAYYFLLLAVVVAGTFIIISSDIHAFRKSLFWSFIFDSNYYFSTLDTYFGAENSENPFLHTWTLGIEMQFYLLLPFLLYFVKKKWLLPTVSVLIVALFAYSTIRINAGEKNLMYFSLLARIPEFLVGVLCGLVASKIKMKGKVPLFMSIAGLLLLSASAVLISEHSAFPGALALMPCLGAAFLVLAPDNPIRRFLSKKVLFFIGELSYSLYLWHWPVMAFFRYYYSTYEFTGIQVVVIVILTAGLSFLSYYCIEKYLRKQKGIRFWGPLMLFAGINAASVLLIIPVNKRIDVLPSTYTAPVLGLKSHGHTFTHVETFGDTLAVTDKILLLGDSHALCMKSYLDYLGKKNGFSFRTITNDVYPTIPGLTKEEIGDKGRYEQYANLLKYVNEEVPESKIIILAYSFEGEQLNLALVSNFISGLKPDQHFILVSDFPMLDKNPIRINRGIVRNPERVNSYEVKRHELPLSIMDFIASTPQCHYLDLIDSDLFASAPFYRDTVTYYDRGHLNYYGAVAYAKYTEKEFMGLLNSITPKP